MYEQEVLNLLKTETVFLGSLDGNQPRVRPMKLYVDKEGHIWLFSPFETRKVVEMKNNPRIEICVGINSLYCDKFEENPFPVLIPYSNIYWSK